MLRRDADVDQRVFPVLQVGPDLLGEFHPLNGDSNNDRGLRAKVVKGSQGPDRLFHHLAPRAGHHTALRSGADEPGGGKGISSLVGQLAVGQLDKF